MMTTVINVALFLGARKMAENYYKLRLVCLSVRME